MGIGIGAKLQAAGRLADSVLRAIVPPMVHRDELVAAIAYVEYAGAPSSVVPDFIGQKLFDTSGLEFYIAYGTAAGEWLPMGLNTLSATELAYLDGALATNLVASKAVITGSGGIIQLTGFDTAVEAAEHGAGAIGTAFTPTTHRWTENGVIVTQIKFDMTGLASVADADDVIGLSAGGAAYIGRNVVANNGIIFKAQLACLETPAGGDNDIDLRTSSSAVAAHDTDGAAFGSVFNSGDWVAGTCRENLLPGLTANDYFYLTAGTGDTAAAYTAGMYVLTLYGHAVLA